MIELYKFTNGIYTSGYTTMLFLLCLELHSEVGEDMIHKNSSGDEIANVNFLTTISHTRKPTSKYRKRDKPTSFNELDDR